jgi:type VI secretion system VasD/TssJ family lipoprotein
MKRAFVVTAIIIFIFGIAACSSAPKVQIPSPPPPPPPPDYRKAAIELILKADPRLNLYRATPHTLVACIYELRDPNAFNQLIDEQDGLPKLLECGRFDGSVAYVKKLVLQPGQEVNEVLDQAEGAKYLGLVAGYFVFEKEKPYRLYRIPTAAGGKPASMKVDLYLGPQTIQDRGAK